MPKLTVIDVYRADDTLPILKCNWGEGEVEITGWKTRPRNAPGVLPATSPELEGQQVVLVEDKTEWFSEQKSWLVRQADGPGAWLTHGQAR